ncbi:ABC transporter transmembrane domain-containing protein [Kribbella sp. GL6]|uniref:ABC transporter transmembrane domain-containing protein n=1 Tax=Kribbella sp. GL6 TaxID=3419765 RepID=UPI003CFF9245
MGFTLGSVVAGMLAARPSWRLVGLLMVCVVGGAVINSVGKVVWVGVSDRVEGRLREDVLLAAIRQPLAVLSEQAVGEILDRVDDDSHEVGALLRSQVWMLAGIVLGTIPMWIVAGATWWPAVVLFPVLAVVTWYAVRKLLAELAGRKVVEEIAWTDHTAVLEEGIAGRDDLRTSLGQAHVLLRVARLSAVVHEKFNSRVSVDSRIARRAGVLLQSLGSSLLSTAAFLWRGW